jgi:hypothetical protein
MFSTVEPPHMVQVILLDGKQSKENTSKVQIVLEGVQGIFKVGSDREPARRARCMQDSGEQNWVQSGGPTIEQGEMFTLSNTEISVVWTVCRRKGRWTSRVSGRWLRSLMINPGLEGGVGIGSGSETFHACF